ncbi:hypothetical protein N665_0188s0454 [Sinapis alba]|nr:hypothetical protein N665_0188s0454 [Sinapis alba]
MCMCYIFWSTMYVYHNVMMVDVSMVSSNIERNASKSRRNKAYTNLAVGVLKGQVWCIPSLLGSSSRFVMTPMYLLLTFVSF